MARTESKQVAEVYTTLGESINLRALWEAGKNKDALKLMVEEFYERVEKAGGVRDLAALGVHYALHDWHSVFCDDPNCRHHQGPNKDPK